MLPLDKLAAAVSSADKSTARNILGEHLYPKVQAIMLAAPSQYAGAQPGKITGMLLELDAQEVIGLLDDGGGLAKKISEACDVLRKATNPR